MKVLLVTPNFAPDVGGVETMLTNLCRYLASEKHDVSVITYNSLFVKTKKSFKESLYGHVTVWRIPWVGHGFFNIFEHLPFIQFFYLVPALSVSTLIFLLLTKKRPEVIHSFGLSGAFAGGLSSRIFNIPCVADMCTVYRLPLRPWLAFFTKVILGWCDYVRANNIVGQDELLKIGVDPKCVGVISPPVDETIFKPIPQKEARLKIGLSGEGFVSLFIGRMVEGKNVELAISATRLIADPNVVFVFVGEGPLQHLIEDAAQRDKRIICVGNVRHEDLPFYYNAADVLMCAPVDKELIAFVGREALMCGLPILAPKSASYFGITYMVNTNLFPPEAGRMFELTSEDLANCLNEFIKAKVDSRRSIYSRDICRKFAVNNFSYQAINWLSGTYAQAKSLRLSAVDLRDD